jgi:hypothetical protein
MLKRLPVRIFVPLCIAVAFIAQMAIPAGCANIVPPLGGPRDSLPPVLVRARPADSSRNIDPKRIVFEFDEFVQVEQGTDYLLVSPTLKTTPGVEARLRTITLTIKDTLDPNTTYTFDFGNGIKDINEANVYKDFRYTFSTGPTIDSLRFSGTVLLAETGKADSTLIAVLYNEERDSAVYKLRPRYITRVDRDGNFRFQNLPQGTFYLYALKPDPGSKNYTSPEQLFAFADTPIVMGKSSRVTLYAYAEQKEKPVSSTPGVTRPTGLRGSGAAADKRLRLETNLDNNEQDLLKPFEVYFRQGPLKEFDSTKIVFTDEKFTPITNYRIYRDTTNTKLTLEHRWTENTAYNIIVDKDFATDSLGRKLLKTDTLSFRTKKNSSYGVLKLRFVNLDLSLNPVLQFVQNGEVVLSAPLTSRDYVSRLFVPGDYDLRILIDDNKNGKWDPGKFFGTRRQPERVIPITRKLTVKANWDNEIDITL